MTTTREEAKAFIGDDITRKWAGQDTAGLPRTKTKHLTVRKDVTCTEIKSFVEIDGTPIDEDELDEIKEVLTLTACVLDLVRCTYCL